MNNKFLKNTLLAVVILIAIDIFSKIISYIFLPEFSEIIIIQNFISFYKTYNETGLAGGTQSLLEYKLLIIIVSMIYLISGLLILIIKYIKKLKIKFLSIGIIIFISIILFILFSIFNETIINLNNYLFVILRGIGPVILVFSLFFIINEKYVKIMFMTLFAGNAGNFLSSFYPPFKVVDFIRLLIPFNINLLDYNFSISDFIFNIADIYIFVFILLLFILPVYLLIKLFIKLVFIKKSKLYIENNKNS